MSVIESRKIRFRTSLAACKSPPPKSPPSQFLFYRHPEMFSDTEPPVSHALTQAYKTVQGWGQANPSDAFSTPNHDMPGARDMYGQNERNREHGFDADRNTEIDMRDHIEARAHSEGLCMD